MMERIGTKGEVLEYLSSRVKHATILPQFRFTKGEYQATRKSIISKAERMEWMQDSVVVRSSALSEDAVDTSMAGHFTSVLNVQGKNALELAIERVISSFDARNDDDQVLIQPMLTEVIISGVAFSKNPSTGAPYIIINVDDTTGSTDSVTSGVSNELRAYCFFRGEQIIAPSPMDKVVMLLNELEQILETDQLDIEFAITTSGELFLFQVRPLVLAITPTISRHVHQRALEQVKQKIKDSSGTHPYLYGRRPMFGIMPDWNPAEIIGVRPKPLALSLYKEIVTDHIWAYQRDNYGYRNLRSFPLLIDFHGLPYIDVRVSFNSFIPKNLDARVADQLVNYYLDRLEQAPDLHDKVEFEIIFSCYTLDLPERLQTLLAHGFGEEDVQMIANDLRELTNGIIDREEGLWKSDLKKIDILEEKYMAIMQSDLDSISKVYWLLEDCKRYGTLPFAGLARAGFIAVQMLESLVTVGILTRDECQRFLQSLRTVGSLLTHDIATLPRKEFLEKFGHLRPGTYDILSARYDEEPNTYFDWEKERQPPVLPEPFTLSLQQMKEIEDLLRCHGLNHNIISLFEFIKGAIEGREYAKFIFSKSLSAALNLVKEIGLECGFCCDECAFIDAASFKKLYSSSLDVKSVLQQSIVNGKASYAITKQILLPPLMYSPEHIFSFEFPASEPNFITLKTVKGSKVYVSDDKAALREAILFIPNADPGYDWIFSHDIGGFITMYGGINSHMAIRASELGIPAVIGAGHVLYSEWEKGNILEIDCANRLVRVLR